MFKQVLRLRTPHNLSCTKGVRKETTGATLSQPHNQQHGQLSGVEKTTLEWDLFSAVCVERHPVIVKPMEDVEARYFEYLQRMQLRNSLKSDFEIKHEKEEIELKKKEKNIALLTQTTKDLEEKYSQELKNFRLAPIVTESDERNDTKSLNRKLAKSLFLLTKQTIGDKELWIPPQGLRMDGESMRQAAERVLTHSCGSKIKVSFYGNAPIGFYKYKYPKDAKKGIYGAKIFYFLAKYIEGDVSNEVNYQWLDYEELAQTVHPKMHKSLSLFIIPP